MTNFFAHARRAQGFIETDSRLRILQTHVHEIMRLQRIWQGIVPAELAAVSRIGQIDADAISIYADNGAAAAKLRQLLPRIAESLKEQGVSRRTMLVKVRAQAIPDRYRPVRTPQISQTALTELDNLRLQLEDGTLKAALSRLLGRHRA